MEKTKKVYMVKKDTAHFKQSDIVESYKYQPYVTKITVTDGKVIGKWPCCGCNMYRTEVISTRSLEYIGEF
jgi:hypothetical protein